ncbi:MAG TPA: RNA pyrophosphohydrolase, partial [Allosphingosinicella sp.]|nr:RNA pyrophosphohydrolase [Allosphingosinicella sp.]
MLLNRAGKVFVAQRRDSTLEAWQMPQGGLDPGEDPQDGALRELEEETGIPPGKVEVIARCPVELTYDLPDDLVGKMWQGKWRGQRQTWFLMRFLGEDKDVDLDTPDP